MRESLQQHVDKLDTLKKQVAGYDEDLRNILLQSDFVEVALQNDPEQLKEFTRQLFGGLVQDNELLFADAANSAQEHAMTVVQELK